MTRPVYATRGPDAGAASERAVDLVFAISGTRLPADYALSLWEALVGRLAWLAEEPGVGVHAIRASAGEGGLLLSRFIMGFSGASIATVATYLIGARYDETARRRA